MYVCMCVCMHVCVYIMCVYVCVCILFVFRGVVCVNEYTSFIVIYGCVLVSVIIFTL